MTSIKSEDAMQYTANRKPQSAHDLNEQEQSTINAALRILSSRINNGDEISNPQQLRDYLNLKIGFLEHEVFIGIFLDARNRVIADVELAKGTIDGAAIYPREVVNYVLLYNASAVVFAHNHPSGITKPSDSDKHITTRLKDALSLIDVRVLDHLVCGFDGGYSFAENGLL